MMRKALIHCVFSLFAIFLFELNFAFSQPTNTTVLSNTRAPDFVLTCPWNGTCGGSGCVPPIECSSLISNQQVPIGTKTCALNSDGAIGICCPHRIGFGPGGFGGATIGFSQPGAGLQGLNDTLLRDAPAHMPARAPSDIQGPPINFTTTPRAFFTTSTRRVATTTTTISPPSNALVQELNEEIESASLNASKEFVEDEKFELELVEQGQVVQQGSSDDLHSMFTEADSESTDSADESFLQFLILNEIAEHLNKTFLHHLDTLIDRLIDLASEEDTTSASAATERSKRVKRIPRLTLASLIGGGGNISLARLCDAASQPDCDVSSKYQTLDGTCNNVENKNWGAALFRFRRWFPIARYEDGLSEPRLSVSGEELPSCRLISSTIVKAKPVDNLQVDALFASFGQFLDHDLSQTTTSTVRDKDGKRLDPQCCDTKTHEVLKNFSKSCFAIEIPGDDPYYSKSNRRCMSLIRSNIGKADHCRPGPRQQQNGISSYIDGSQIYGTRSELAKNLREFKGGRMKVCVDANGREFPVHTTDNENGDEARCTDDVIRGQFNFLVGDQRAHIQPLLVVFHVIFIREHNRIAAELINFHTNWDDETLYQETRRIMRAILQRIIYNEFLPPLLGDSIMHLYDLHLENCGFYDHYDSNENAGILNEFATAAFRFGHSLIQPIFRLISANEDIANEPLEGIFFKQLRLDKFEQYVKGAVNQTSQNMDNNMVEELTNKLFSNPRFSDPGKDLASLNCQRGRDHGIGTYTDLQNHAGLSAATSFEDLKEVMDPDVAEAFKQVYKNVEDIDLWVAGISEKPIQGGIVGPVFANIIGEQFKRLRIGDRFWFERSDTTGHLAFTEDQLSEIRKISLARILCDNTDVTELQPLVLLQPSKLNAVVSCDSAAIPKMSFIPWQKESV